MEQGKIHAFLIAAISFCPLTRGSQAVIDCMRRIPAKVLLIKQNIATTVRNFFTRICSFTEIQLISYINIKLKKYMFSGSINMELEYLHCLITSQIYLERF